MVGGTVLPMQLWGGFTFLSAEEMSKKDGEAIDGFGIGAELLMEDAGLATASVARKMMGGVAGRTVDCLVGKGNNGGDGLVAARHLSNWGADVELALGCRKDELRDTPAKQLAMVDRMGLRVRGPGAPLRMADLVVDGLLGYGAKGIPRGEAADLIRACGGSRAPVLAVDVPSGLDATTGQAYDPCIKARATVTFGYPKTGFLTPGAREYVGELYLAYISLPSLRTRGGSAFSEDSVVRVW